MKKSTLLLTLGAVGVGAYFLLRSSKTAVATPYAAPNYIPNLTGQSWLTDDMLGSTDLFGSSSLLQNDYGRPIASGVSAPKPEAAGFYL